MSDNSVLYVAKLHWIIFLGPALLFVGSFFLDTLVPQLNSISMVLMLAALAWIGTTWLNYHFSSLEVTESQITMKHGVLIRQSTAMPIGKIEAIDIRQSIFGTMLRYGSLIITGTGGTRQIMAFVAKPLTCRRYIEQLLA